MKRYSTGNRFGFIIAAGVAAACATTHYGATDANMASARSTAPEGATLFAQNCAPCHGERGESASRAPRILGPGALPEYPRQLNPNTDPALSDPASVQLQAQSRPEGAPRRDPFRTAQDLYNFISKKMPQPPEAAGSLAADEYWAILNFMLRAHGVPVPSEGVTPANASSVKL
jgi:hypothetical protein